MTIQKIKDFTVAVVEGERFVLHSGKHTHRLVNKEASCFATHHFNTAQLNWLAQALENANGVTPIEEWDGIIFGETDKWTAERRKLIREGAFDIKLSQKDADLLRTGIHEALAFWQTFTEPYPEPCMATWMIMNNKNR